MVTRWLLLLVIGIAALYWLNRSPLPPVGKAALVSAPLVMRTEGGRLEVASVKARESFNLADGKSWMGISLGTTYSEIRADAHYRYYIEMAKEWPIEIDASGKVATVRAGAVRPQWPVAIDSTTMERHTSSGWARFNKHENLQALEQSLTPRLEQRSNDYTAMAADAGRRTVREFVTTWLIRERHWQEGGEGRVVVLFPDEVEEGVKAVP